ncbi:MAG: cysteine desulfurase [Fimbriimonadaceae bacterium]|nr:cysteine desulfurase [Chthonomonadaceae bacterium]MCO5298197.1 cysteine desulfurase [Fimbriimonadaceae bacterium]
MTPIYLDHAATSPLRPESRAAMHAVEGEVGNPSSLHGYGRRVLRFVDEAREAVARAFGGAFAEIVFTSGGTEAANLAVVGTALAHQGTRRRVLASAGEHPCVLQTAPLLERLGFRLETVPIDRVGRLDLDALRDALGDDVLLVALMHANNELGTRQPVADAARLAHHAGALLFTDAVQTFGAETGSVEDLGADLASMAAHKFGGPLGVGALWVRGGVEVEPLLRGGAQERERRGGTENWLALAGVPAALSAVDPVAEAAGKAACRAAFLGALEGAPVRSVPEEEGVLPGHLHVRFPGVSAESLLIALDRLGVAAGSGSACSSGAVEPSHVLRAAGYDEREQREGVRFTFGWSSTVEESREAARRVSEAVRRILGR